MPVVQHLFIYPVKSMRGIPCGQAQLTVRGLEYDRNWMVTDENGNFRTQRDLPGLALIIPGIAENELILKHNLHGEIRIPVEKSGDSITVNIWGDSCKAIDQGDEVAAWIKMALNHTSTKELRLMRFDSDYKRKVDDKYLKGEKSHTAFADGFPFLITTRESLQSLNDRLISSGHDAVPMNRFRPNIVVSGAGPFQEDHSQLLRQQGGKYELGIRKPCKRCVITTRNQDTAKVQEPGEPLRTLISMKTIPDNNGAFFGQNATLLKGNGHLIRVGDTVNFD